MTRRVFIILCALSLSLCITAAMLWPRTWHRSGEFIYARTTSNGKIMGCGLVSFRGRVFLVTGFGDGADESPRRSEWQVQFEHDTPNALLDLDIGSCLTDAIHGNGRAFGGFGVLDTTIDSGVRLLALMLPHWFLILLLGVLPSRLAIARLKSARSIRRQNRGLCARCGYDLRASSGRCPECWTAIPQKTETQR